MISEISLNKKAISKKSQQSKKAKKIPDKLELSNIAEDR